MEVPQVLVPAVASATLQFFSVLPIFGPSTWLSPWLPVEGFHSHEALDLLSIWIVVLSLWWVYFRVSKADQVMKNEVVMLLLSTTTMIEGHGIHLAANAEDRLLYNHKVSLPTLYNLNYFFDEVLGHHLWFSGEALLWILIVLKEKETSLKDNWRSSIWTKVFSLSIAILHGMSGFMKYIEGQTVTLGVTFCFIVFALRFWELDKKKQETTAADFMTQSCIVTLTAIGVWGYWHSGTFPEFRVLGLGHFRQWPREIVNRIMVR